MSQLEGKRILITGGTGSLGTALAERLLKLGMHKSITVFSRGEAKQYEMRIKYPQALNFVIGDVRDFRAVCGVVVNAEIIFHTAALKHVSACEENIEEALLTNVYGAMNIVRAIKETRSPVETVIGISTDKGCHAINVYGNTKSLQQAVLISANKVCPNTRFICVLYGNVMASSASVIPLFQNLAKEGKPITINDPEATRFLVSKSLAVDTLLAALETAKPGEVYTPSELPSATVSDIATVIINGRDIEMEITGPRPFEKKHELLISGDDINRTLVRDGYYVVSPEIQRVPALSSEYSSTDCVISRGKLREMFKREGLI